MKKIMILTVLILGILALAAETPKEEALQSLEKARKLVVEDNWVKAQDEINFTLAKISEIQAELLINYLPEPLGGYTLENKESNTMGQAGAIIGSANSFSATGEYSKGETNVKVVITVGGVLGQAGGLMGMANMFGGMGNTGSSKTVRVGNYNGNLVYDKDENSGTLTVQVGQKITVSVEGSTLPSADILKGFAEKMDLAKLEKMF